MSIAQQKNPRDKQWSTHETKAFPYNHFVSPPKTKGLQLNASAAIVCRQLKPSVTQQGGGGKWSIPKQNVSGGAGEKAQRLTDSTWPFGDQELGGVRTHQTFPTLVEIYSSRKKTNTLLRKLILEDKEGFKVASFFKNRLIYSSLAVNSSFSDNKYLFITKEERSRGC